MHNDLSISKGVYELLERFFYDDGWYCRGGGWTHPTKLTDGNPFTDFTYYSISFAEVAEGYGLDLYAGNAEIKCMLFYFRYYLELNSRAKRV
jgi:hypothetical protein